MQLIEDWKRKLFTLASMRLAWLAALLTSYIAAYPEEWAEFVALFPVWSKPLIGIAVLAIAGSARLVEFRRR